MSFDQNQDFVFHFQEGGEFITVIHLSTNQSQLNNWLGVHTVKLREQTKKT